MFSITEQFSAATKSQLEAQLSILNSFASKAVDSAEKVIALNLSTTKATVETSSSAAKQLFAAKNPQEFFSLGGAQQPGLDSLFAYGRQLFSIASSAQAELIKTAQEQIKDASALVGKAAPKLSAVPALKAPAAAVVAPVAVKPANEALAAPVAKAPAKPKAEAKPAVKAEAEPVAAPVEAKPVEAAKPAVALVTEDKAAAPAKAKVEAKVDAKAETKVDAKVDAKAAPAKQLDMLSGNGKGKK